MSMSDEMFAFSELDGAFKRTRELLWPIRWGVWLRLAVVALFVGGGVIDPTVLQPGTLSLIAIVLIAALAFIYIGAVVQFVFVDCLASGRVVLYPSFRRRLGEGGRLFAFELALVLLLLAFVGVVVLALRSLSPQVSWPVLLLAALPIILLIFVVYGVVHLLTTDFVVPIMILEDCGVIAGWRRLCRTLSPQVMQTAVYIVVRFLLGIAAGIVQGIATLLALAAIAIPFVLLGLALLALAVVAVPVLLVLLAVPFLVIAIPAALLIAVPFVTFFRYYSLQVLGRLAPAYRILPE